MNNLYNTQTSTSYQSQAAFCEPSNPTLQNTAAEALKWISELSHNLELLEIGLFSGPCKPLPPVEKITATGFPGLESQLRDISSQCANLVGFTGTLLTKV